MNKILIWSLVFVLCSSVALAAQQDTQRQQNTERTTETYRYEQIQIPEAQIQETQRLWQQEREQLQERQQDPQIEPTRQEARVAAQYMYMTADSTGGCQDEFCGLSEQYRNSLSTQEHMEQRIEQRSGMYRFFMGTDIEAARTLEREREENQERIRQLRLLADHCNCTDQTRSQMHEWIQSMENEQHRVQAYVHEEENRRGIFRWRLFR